MHYSTSSSSSINTTTWFAVQHAGTGWVGIAFATTPGVMVGSQAAILTPGQSPPVQVYDLTSRSSVGVFVANRGFAIDGVEVLSLGSGVGFVFSRAADPSFSPAAVHHVLVARAENDTGVGYHGALRASMSISLAVEGSGDPKSNPSTDGGG